MEARVVQVRDDSGLDKGSSIRNRNLFFKNGIYFVDKTMYRNMKYEGRRGDKDDSLNSWLPFQSGGFSLASMAMLPIRANL